MSGDRIISIQGLELQSRIGVPEEERAQAQRLLADLRFASIHQPPDLGDDLSLTVDYHAVALRVAAIAGEEPRRLIETLADEVAAKLLQEFGLQWIEITIRKFILPQTEWVAVSIRQESNGNNGKAKGRKVG
jgi:FolB domain-containing protein